MSLRIAARSLAIQIGLFERALRLDRRLRPQKFSQFRYDVQFYQTLLPAGALCFDVGANIGMKSEALLSAGMRVVAFEPNPELLPELQARCGQHPNWTLVPTALGSGSGVAELHVRGLHGAKSSLEQDWQGGGEVAPAVSRHYVPVVTLDAAIATFGNPFYCKIDVEGWELDVLKGLTKPIPLMSFEFHLFDKDIAKTCACLNRLLELAGGQVNLVPGEGGAFHLPEWVALEQFAQHFPGDLKRTLPGNPQDLYGDIVVKMPSAG